MCAPLHICVCVCVCLTYRQSSGQQSSAEGAVEDSGEVIHSTILLTSGSKVKIQGAPTLGQPAHILILIASIAIPASKDNCIWLKTNPKLLHDPTFLVNKAHFVFVCCSEKTDIVS